MKPYSSSSEKENCSPVSSNCVEWQGPFIECINICKGDSVSDIVYKLSEKVCNIEGGTTITDVNLACILEACPSLSAPTGTLGSILQTIANGLCCSVSSLNLQTSQLQARTANLYNEPSLVLPTNFQYVDPSTGLPVARLPLSDYAVNTATNTSTLKSIVDTHTTQISNQESRVQTLENNPGYIPPTVIPTCTYSTLLTGIPTQMNYLLEALESDYCIYKLSIGSQGDMAKVGLAQPSYLNSSNALGQSGTMSGITGWNVVVNNLSQSIQNLWLTVADMRVAVDTIKQNIVPDCSKFLLGFTSTTNTGRTTVTLTFNALTTIPSGFSNCAKLSTVTISDGLNTYANTLDLVSYATNPSGITFNITSAGLNPALPYTITVNGCIINGTTTCNKTVTNTNLPATTTTVPPASKQYTVNITQLDIDDSTGNTDSALDSKVWVSYIDQTGTTIVNSYSVTVTITICTSPNTSPIIYYYKNNTVHTGSSVANYLGACLL